MGSPNRVSSSAFSALPTEIKLEIFGHVRSKADQGRACLVSQEWNRLVRPQKWREFTTSLTSNLAGDLHTPSEEQKACFRRIHALAVGGRRVVADYDSRLSFLLQLLRDDQLREFNSATETPVHARLLLGLLRHQANLKCLRVRLDWAVGADAIDEVASWTVDSTSLLASALRRLKTLRIYIGDSLMPGAYTQALHDYEVAYNGLLLAAAPHLDRLEICGWRWQGMSQHQEIRLNGPLEHPFGANQIPRTLRHLIIADLDLSGAEDGLVRALNLETLSLLKLEYCDRVGAFLRVLAAALRRKTKIPLKTLTVRTSPRNKGGKTDCMLGALDDLLQSFDGLVELECNFFFAAYVDWKSSLCRHPGLRKLHISSVLMTDGYASYPGTIIEILARCRNLHYFAYHPVAPYFDCIIDCELPTELSSRFCESLDAVAAAPALCMLRLLYAPGIDEDKLNRHNDAWVEKAAQIAQRFATLVLTYIHLRGSNIRVLALSPESRWKQDRGDSNLHFYPHYFYKLQIAEFEGQRIVNAVPLRDYVAECPEFAVFT